MTTPPVAAPASTPKVETPAPISKTVTLRCANGVWEADVELIDVTKPFTQRDFNQLSRLISLQVATLRRKASLAFVAATKKAAAVAAAKAAAEALKNKKV